MRRGGGPVLRANLDYRFIEWLTMRRFATRENLLALLLCLLVVLLLVVATDSAPQWIYQGF